MNKSERSHHTNWEGRPRFFVVSLFFLTSSLPLFITGAAGCATPHQAKRFEGGFTDVALSDDVFEIGFTGNTSVDAKGLEQSLLQRAAQATRAHGFTHFVIEGRNWQGGLGFVFRLDRIGPARHVERSIRIRCYSGEPGVPNAYDAEALLHPSPVAGTSLKAL